MKKEYIFLAILLLTGCKNQLECIKEEQSEEYKTEQKLIFKFDKNDKINDSTINYIMTFENEETAKAYLTIFESLDTDYEITLKDNKISVVSNNDYSYYSQNKDKLKSELEDNGYSCK